MDKSLQPATGKSDPKLEPNRCQLKIKTRQVTNIGNAIRALLDKHLVYRGYRVPLLVTTTRAKMRALLVQIWDQWILPRLERRVTVTRTCSGRSLPSCEANCRRSAAPRSLGYRDPNCFSCIHMSTTGFPVRSSCCDITATEFHITANRIDIDTVKSPARYHHMVTPVFNHSHMTTVEFPIRSSCCDITTTEFPIYSNRGYITTVEFAPQLGKLQSYGIQYN